MRTTSALKISVAIEKVPVVLASNRLIKMDRGHSAVTSLAVAILSQYSAFVKFQQADVRNPAADRLSETLSAFYQIS
jgi:hypothetical protein